jgi:hypothetical protein
MEQSMASRNLADAAAISRINTRTHGGGELLELRGDSSAYHAPAAAFDHG